MPWPGLALGPEDLRGPPGYSWPLLASVSWLLLAPSWLLLVPPGSSLLILVLPGSS